MATDFAKLFNKRLCDEVQRLDRGGIDGFVRAYFGEFDQWSVFRFGFEESVPVSERVAHLLANDFSEETLKEELVNALCISKESISLDYWACYMEVFGSDPEGSIADLSIFPHLFERSYLLLLPQHIDDMLTSLQEHREKVTVMGEKGIIKLRTWRDICAADNGFRVAYFFD